jgi:hypothetical protein
VHEHVVAAVVRLNESKTLGSVKPLHGSHAHGVVPSQYLYAVEARFVGGLVKSIWKGRQRKTGCTGG